MSQIIKKLVLMVLPNSFKRKMLIRNILNGPPMPMDDIIEARKTEARMMAKIPKLSFAGSIKDTMAEPSQRKTPVRIYTPQGTGPFPVVMYMHGGGFCLGNLDTADNACRVIARAANCVLISVDYGLAPECKFPHALEECYQVVNWIRKNAIMLNINPNKLAIAGDSAGANLTAALCMLARDRKEFTPILQVLICPPLDMAIDHAIKAKDLPAEILLTTPVVRKFCEYVFNDLAETKNALASPVYAENLTGLPPAIIITADLDPLEKEGLKYAELLRKAGNKVILKQYRGLMHDFLLFAGFIDEGKEAAEAIGKILNDAFK